MKTVYFIRHGETEGNASKKFQSSEISLSEKGKKEVALVAERCLSLDAEVIISSSMTRAKETSQAIVDKTNLPVLFSDDLREVKVPSLLVGLEYQAEEAKDFWDYLENHFYQNPDQKFTDGESYEEVILRVKSVLRMLEERPENEIIVVAHGRILRAIFAFVLVSQQDAKLSGVVDKSIELMDNTAVSVLQFGEFEDKKWLLSIYNDKAHFAE
jgi:broad specificity phosphatase PhoE